MSAKILTLYLASGFMIVAFQNCSPAGFSAGASDAAALSESNTPNSTMGVPAASPAPAASPKPGDGGPAASPSPNPSPNPSGASGSGGGSGGSGGDDGGKDPTVTASSSDYVACILEGPGKSVKLGIANEKLQGVNSVSDSVCVTADACLGIIAQKLQVKTAVERGYCEGNPNVLRLDDTQVQSLLP